MKRYLLDTNLLVFLILGQIDELLVDVSNVLEDYNNEIYTSSICIAELVQLFRLGKIKPNKNQSLSEIIKTVEEQFFIKILSFSKEHIHVLAKLEIVEKHNDPFDHMIISHAITEKLCLISSDKMFANYTNQNLDFIFNKR